MSRLIDADELYELIEKDFDGVCVYDVEPSEAVNDFQHIVDLAPTVDAVEVVHCKECKYRGEYFSCPIPYRTDDDFFCKNGERNEVTEHTD